MRPVAEVTAVATPLMGPFRYAMGGCHDYVCLEAPIVFAASNVSIVTLWLLSGASREQACFGHRVCLAYEDDKRAGKSRGFTLLEMLRGHGRVFAIMSVGCLRRLARVVER